MAGKLIHLPVEEARAAKWRRGFPMVGITEDLRRLCERTRAIYRAAAGIVAKGQSGEGR